MEIKDLDGLNIPESFKEKVITLFGDKIKNIQLIKANITSQITNTIIQRAPKMEKNLWEAGEIEFLKHGTTKEDVALLVKQIILCILQYILTDIVENALDDSDYFKKPKT